MSANTPIEWTDKTWNPVVNLNSLRGWDFVRVGKKRAGAEIDGREWRESPT